MPQVSKSGNLGYKIVVLILIVAIAALAYPQVSGPAAAGRSKAEQSTVDIYRIITGGDVEVLKTEEVSGLYRITLRLKSAAGADTIQDTYVTKDGMFFTANIANIDEQKTALTAQSAFARCLLDRKVIIFGLSTDQATQVQLQALGAFSNNLYFDCSGQNLAVCQQLNITSVPTIFVNGFTVPGPQGVQWFEQNIGCYMAANATSP